MKKIFTISWLLAILAGICYIFWYNEWKYNLPTPVPNNYRTVKIGEHIDINAGLKSASNKPLFIHFFNPDCPCSRFNIPHFKSLVRKYGDRIEFAVVIINKSGNENDNDIKEKYYLDVPVISDPSIAVACGVYSTPQAVLLDAHRDLYYRGNYNKSRYCTDTHSNYAQMAIDSLLASASNPSFGMYATKAYGCQLTYCTR